MYRYYKLCINAFSAMAIALVVLGCNSSTPETDSIATTPAATQTSTANNAQASTEKIKFKQANGAEKFSLKFKSDGAKLVDGADAEIARLNLDGNKVKIKDAADVVIGYVVSQDGYWKLENAEQTEELYVLRRQDDGDYKLETGDDTPVYRVKARDYGYEIETPAKESLYKVKVKKGKISLRDASEETVLSTKSAMTPAAMVPFGFDVLTPPQQAALAYAVNLTGGQ